MDVYVKERLLVMSTREILIVVTRLMVEISVLSDRSIKCHPRMHIEFPECTIITNDTRHFCDGGPLHWRAVTD